ncbi:rab11 family-interacting protein 4A isoform X3 [Hyposmocoma kahamanoa]|uniref:rab11 family-interacting protein 4A isoform X3 n=1 Tax=Hyposmocoma kahamanoa TaxID=1477025 RepID=UPI000E6D7AA5|nr:rab11 family-interacting protein 4A isoform X3 [Hyposmocoma kahamanoa]
MWEVVLVLRSDAADVFRVLEAWWQAILLLGKLVLCCFQLIRQTIEVKLSTEAMMAPSVFQRTKSPRSSPSNLPNKLQNGTEAASQPEPTADSSPGNSISDAENFECYGEADADVPASNPLENRSRSPANHLNRHSWTRTSLRRTPPSSGKRQIGSNVLASQLYRSSSFNSSGCGSGGEPADDMYSDVSLEEDVQGLNYKVQLLQQQVTSLADTQSTADDRYARAKAENAVLQARVHILDEQIREIECRCDERIAEEQRRCREAISRLERDRDQQLSALNDRLSAAETEASDLKQEVGRLRGVAETLRANAEATARAHREAQEQVAELLSQLSAARESERRERDAATAATELLTAAKLELQRIKETPPPPPDPRLDEMRKELLLLRTHNKSLTEAQEELQAQILTRGVEEGRSLLDGVNGPLCATNSLAHELSQMSDDELDGSDTLHSIELEKLQKALKEQQDVNVQLRNYIDGILLSIVENYPQLLEVKYQKQSGDIKS